MDLNLDFKNSRAQAAKFFRLYGKLIKIFCPIVAAVLMLAGVVGLLYGKAISWLVLSCGLWVLVPWLYTKNYLEKSPASRKQANIADVLSGEVLGLLEPDKLSPQDIMTALKDTPGARFLFNRLGLPAEVAIAQTPTDKTLTNSIWQQAISLWTHTPEPSNTVSSIMVVAAIVRLNPLIDDTLRSLRVDNDDVYMVVDWFEHIGAMKRSYDQPRLTGGVARDWSFGYIPTLERMGVNLSSRYSAGGRSMASSLSTTHQIVDQMIDLLSRGARRNVALIGQVGVGKSTMVDALAERLMDATANTPKNVKFNQVIMLDASSIISATQGRGQVEGLVNQIMVEAYRAKNIILFLDNAELFFENGTGSLDLSNLLQPAIEGGGLKLILAMDEQRYLQIAQAKPALGAALNRIEVKPMSEQDTLRVLEDQSISIEYQSHVFYDYQALKEIYRLSSRYVNDVGQPRASVQLMQNAVPQAQNGLITPPQISDTIEKTLGIKVGGNLMYGTADSTAEKQKLLNLEDLIHQRMINQSSAVKAVSSALRRARAGVRNENRPIGTFLFLGPTGVGKTELAKSLAAVYFGGEDNMVRIDMNEYTRNEDVARLIADGATDPMSLSAQVQKNPFSVVLLDEIEKAHPNVLTTLLQVLDEGVLRDINNKPVSFRDAIVIATSNAGADRVRQYIEAGYQVEQFSAQIQDELVRSGQFKPEFLNRFDEIAVFRPLTKDELLQVVDLILIGVNKNLANQKVSVAVDKQGKQLLVEAGYDPLLGARPMRRVVQRSVENIVAEKMLSGELVPGSGIMLTAQDIYKSLSNQ